MSEPLRPKPRRDDPRQVVLCRCHDQQTNAWSMRVTFETPSGTSVLDIPSNVFYNRQKCLAVLRQHGFSPPLSKQAQEKLHDDLVQSVPDKTCLLTHRLGGNGPVYVRRSGNIGSDTALKAKDD